MKLKEYFETKFWEDVETIPTNKPNETILGDPNNFFVHKEILFFGGKDWESYNNDIELIDNENHENFIFSLLIISTIDYYIKNNIDLYKTIQQKFDPPKLGWSGFGPHFEHPYQIIKSWIDQQDQSYDFLSRKDETKDLFEFIISKHPRINIQDFKNLIINNTLNIPEKFNLPVYFEFIENDRLPRWKEIISELMN
jgi:UDP:flavonoid glycosyltransferase YjiC (YdhE family)